MRSAAVDEIAAQGLPAVEAVARHAAVAHEGQRLRGDHLDAGRGEGKENAEHVREESRLRPRRDDHGVGAEGALCGLDRCDAAAARREPGHRRVLEDSPTVVL